MTEDDTEAEARLMAERLEAERPVAAAAFRGDLGRAVALDAKRRHLRPRPSRLWPQVAALAIVGAAFLAFAAAQV
ncbi:MAG: hypothetical protein JWO90_1739 [Solirubrobacterales bacterium]|nr:hypothetical protein [Solirubrobacterales bacterium]